MAARFWITSLPSKFGWRNKIPAKPAAG